MLKFEYNGSWSVGYTGFYYLHTYPNMNKPGTLMPVRSMFYCREYFVKSYRELINKQNGFTPWARNAYSLCSTGRISGSDNFKNWQEKLWRNSLKGLYIVNSFEKEHKWPLTRLFEAQCTNINDVSAVFFTGSRKWTMSPYLMSIWSLIIRLGRNTWLPNGLEKLNHEDLVEKIVKASYVHLGSNDDAAQIYATIKHWDSFMTLYKDLFGGVPRKSHWNVSHLHGGNSRPEGIRWLIDDSTRYKTLRKKYFKLKEEKHLR